MHDEPDQNLTLKHGALTFVDVMVSGLANMGPAMSLFFSMAFLVATIGKAVPFEIVLALFAVLTLGNTMAEFSRKIPSSGSFITFLGHTFGTRFATTSALTLIVGYIIAISGVIAVLGGWVSTLVERYTGVLLPWIVIMIIGSLLIGYLTIRDVKVSAKWAIVMFAFEALILILLSVVILVRGGADGISFTPFNPANTAGGFNGLALGFPLVVFLFVGWENSGALAEETLDPRKNVPRAIYIGIFVMALIYVLTSYSAIIGYGLNPQQLHAFANDQGPFDTLGARYLGPARILVDIAGLTSIFATILAAANSQSRILYNAGRNGLLPRVFGRISKRGRTPYVALATYFGVATLLAIVFGYKIGPNTFFGDASTLGTIPLILIYGITNVALPIYYLRHHRDEFKVFRHLVVPLIGVAAMAWPLWGLVQPGQPWPFNTFPWIVLGIIIASVVWTIVLLRRDKTVATKVLDVFHD
jgi:amino acid transporter